MIKRIKLTGEQKNVLFLPFRDPIQIKGVAGSGKTTVALFRAKHLLETQINLFQKPKVIIFSFNKTLSEYIKAISKTIYSGYQKDSEEIVSLSEDGLEAEVINFHKWAFHFIENNGIPLRVTINEKGYYRSRWKTIDTNEQTEILNTILKDYVKKYPIARKNTEFFLEEISWIKGKMFENKRQYLDTRRTGRGTTDRVTQKDKEIIWNIYQDYQDFLKEKDSVDFDDYALLVLDIIKKDKNFKPPYTHIIIDEAQDLNKAQILAISKLVSNETRSITIIADAAQKIYKSGFTWEEVGINVRGNRTVEFKKNYRNSLPIAKAALSLLSHEENGDFTSTKTALPGTEKPKVAYFPNESVEYNYLLKELENLENNNALDDTVILHRTNKGVNEIYNFLLENHFQAEKIRKNEKFEIDSNNIKLSTMSSIKGLEFDNVFILDLNEDLIPFPPGFSEPNDELHINTERRLLYTSMTRARERLYMFCSDIPTRYLAEIDSSLLENITPDEKEFSMLLDVNKNDDDEDDIPF